MVGGGGGGSVLGQWPFSSVSEDRIGLPKLQNLMFPRNVEEKFLNKYFFSTAIRKDFVFLLGFLESHAVGFNETQDP